MFLRSPNFKPPFVLKYALLIFFGVICLHVNAQSPSDNCSTSAGQQLAVSNCGCKPANFDISSSMGTPALTGCGAAGTRDGWGWFTATTTSTIIQYTNTNRDASIYVYTDNGTPCGGLTPTTPGCVNAVNGTGTETITIPTVVGTRYYVRVVRISGTTGTMDGSICVFNAVSIPVANDNPCTAINLGTPTTTCTYTTYNNCGATASVGNFANPSCANYLGGDVWFKVTVPASGQIQVNTAALGVTNGGLSIYETGGPLCTDTLVEIACNDDASGANQMPTLSVSNAPGNILYIRFWESGNNNNGTFQLCVINPCNSTPANDNPCGAINITPGTTCNYTTYTNNCATSTSGVANPTCGGYLGGDVWFKATVPASGQLIIDSDVGVITDGSMSVYTATGTCPTLVLSEIYCDDDGSSNGLMPYISVVQPAGTVIYIRFWESGNDVKGTFDMCVYNPCPSGAPTPTNNLPCSATFVPFGVPISGNNECANNAGEPATPACFGTGTVNSVWYRFVASSTCATVKTTIGSIANTQIAAYSGTCGPSMSLIGCNNDYTPCNGGYTYQYSQLNLTGLTIGATYYIMVDGRGNNVGSFSLLIANGCGNVLPPQSGQDCSLPILVCNDTVAVADPGYQAVGNICDFGAPSPCTGGTNGCNNCATSCLCSGERGSSWYTINVTSNGFLEFWIIPNDYPAFFGETDYDFALYGPNPGCGNLNSPIRCDYNGNGVTGVYGVGDNTDPPGYPFNGQAFRQRVSALAGETYLLNVSNFTNSTSGFNLIFNTAAGSCGIASAVSPGGTIIWTGAVSTNWFDVNNWGGCQIPDCQVNVVIPSFPVNQPVINGQDGSCRSIDVNVGASLGLNAGRQLMVCYNYTNGGTFTAGNNSTVLFQDTCTTCPGGINHNQDITGNMTAANRFWNVTVNKPSGFSARTYQNIDMAGNFIVGGGVGFGGNFNAINQYHKIAGNFTVDYSPLLATYTPGTTLEFNGTNQNYLNRGVLNGVLMNQTAPGAVTLLDNGAPGTAWMTLSNTGTLTLTYGRILGTCMHATDARVEISSRVAAAVSAGNINSYVQGSLRRYMPNTGGIGSYDFPVGTSARGYERINFNLTAALPNTVDYWDVFFDDAVNPASPAFTTECSSTYHSGLFALNHGTWKVLSSPATLATGTMNVTNYNRGYSNPVLGSGWTVMYNNANNNGVSNWLLQPFPAFPCAAPPITAVLRNSMSVGTLFNSGNPVWFGTAQSLTPLPVELLSFDAKSLRSSILLNWNTGSERNNKGFDVEKTLTPPDNFKKIGWVAGHGSTTMMNYYNFEDVDVKPGKNYYYRLKQIDYNGEVQYSKIIAANIGDGEVTLNVLPNPYANNTNITYSLKHDGQIKLEIFSILGQKVATLVDGYQQSGSYQYQFSAKYFGFDPGMYTIRIEVNEEVYVKRIVETE